MASLAGHHVPLTLVLQQPAIPREDDRVVGCPCYISTSVSQDFCFGLLAGFSTLCIR